MKGIAQFYLALFIVLFSLGFLFEVENLSNISFVYLLTALGLFWLNYTEQFRDTKDTLNVLIKPLGTVLLMFTIYDVLSLLPAIFEMKTLEHPLPQDILERTIWLFLAGIFCFWIGFFLNIGRAVSNSLTLNFERQFSFDSAAIVQISKTYLALGVVLYVLAVWTAGYATPIQAALDMSEFRRKAFSLGATTAIATFMTYALLIPKTLFFAFLANAKHQFEQSQWRFWIAFFIIESAIWVSFGIRGNFVLTGFLAIVMWYHRYRKIPVLTILFLGVLLGGIVALLGEVRDVLALSTSERAALERVRDQLNLSWYEIAFGTVLKRLDALHRFGEIVEGFSTVYSENDLLYGKGTLGDLIAYIPRQLLPFEKPYQTTYYFMEMFYPKLLSIFSFEMSIFGEGYMNFGALGTFITLFLFGIFIRTLNELFREERLLDNSKFYFWYFLLFFPVFLLVNQGFTGGLPNFVLTVLWGAIALGVLSRRSALNLAQTSNPNSTATS
ncbi:MAG: O-antigen polymerase [Chloroherpetonaceae bacterium]